MDDRARVEEQLGRPPRGEFEVVVRDATGDPVVVRNHPFLDDGTPMPTRYYLVGPALVRAVSRLEAAGGVDRAEREIDAAEIAAVHERYAAERDAAIPDDHAGPRPYGGVGGTRIGVKCLHAHVAHQLATGDDVVGRWALDQLNSNEDPGGLTVTIGDRATDVAMTGGGSWTLPLGPVVLVEDAFERRDPPAVESLTNALGAVHDHVDDVLIATPIVAATPSIVFRGHHAISLARVELGDDEVPRNHHVSRAAIEEVFRTLVAEPRAQRRHNPGLDDAHLDTIVATCCVVLAIMRRLGLHDAGIAIDTGLMWDLTGG